MMVHVYQYSPRLDTNAVNYNPGANTDDGSCIYAGCTDPLASNHNASATLMMVHVHTH